MDLRVGNIQTNVESNLQVANMVLYYKQDIKGIPLGRERGCDAIINILNEGISRLPVSGGVPCASPPLGGTIEPFAEVGIDAQKRGENRGEERDTTPEGTRKKVQNTIKNLVTLQRGRERQVDQRGVES